MIANDILDVTVLEPREKHPTIFKKFDSLNPGEQLVIHNDHDPKPLYYQLVGERGPCFTWEYLEEGPEFWKVRIIKNQNESPETIGSMVAKDFRKAEVFKKFGIDFCCGGKKTVAEACKEKGIAVADVERELNLTADQITNISSDFALWDLSFLADYIISKHHSYVKEAIPVLYAYVEKVVAVHGERHPELFQVKNHFITLSNELLEHTKKEEEILFPYIRQMVTAQKLNIPVSPAFFGTVKNPIAMMEAEHEGAGNELEMMKALTDNFSPPENACTTYRVMFQKFKEFEDDLHQHIHLENNILFPKAIELEELVHKSK